MPEALRQVGGAANVRGAMATRALELLFAVYFLIHIPLTLLFNAQAIAPRLYPRPLQELMSRYTASFKDALMAQRPTWLQSFIYCEVFLQLPFFPLATYAFFKGNCKWIRIPVIIYATHTATTVVPMLAEFLFHDFSDSKPAGPQTWNERLWLIAVYSPYLLIPLLLLATMLLHPSYNSSGEKQKAT